MLCQKTNKEDIVHFIEQFKEINEKFEDNVQLVFFGYDYTKDDKTFDDINFEYVKPVSIIHYFKQLKALSLDLLFIPLINNVYNQTSENYNKYMEVGIFGIPVLTVDMHPYNIVIVNRKNGFLFKEPSQMVEEVGILLSDRSLISAAGKEAHVHIVENLNYTDEIADYIAALFSNEIQG